MKKNARITLCGVLVLSAMAVAAPTKRFNTITVFGLNRGGGPEAALVQATDGNLYGTTTNGGTNAFTVGTVFRVGTDGTLTSLYSFCSQSNCSDGGEPTGTLIQATDGNLYGTTQGVTGLSNGTVFKITLEGMLTTIHSFKGSDGALPVAGLTEGMDGNFYGTTYEGGTVPCESPGGCGTIFKITPAGVLTTLYTFCSEPACADGGYPAGRLVQDIATGDFYGTTYSFGTYGGGTVFKFSSSGTFTTLHSFTGPDGMNPYGGLLQASNGAFYGTTFLGGNVDCYAGQGCGTIYRVTRAGAFATLYLFDGVEGSNPKAELVQGTDGNIYGATLNGGGSGNDGSIFRVKFAGKLMELLGFNGDDGNGPLGGLMEATNGILYGTTLGGGTYNQGTIFDLIGLNPFVKMQPNYGTAGTQINILGTELTGATAVIFNGLSAQFTVQSPSLIVATVPAGATSGPIIVALPTQTLSSTFPFYIRP